MTEKTLTTENIKPALDALRGELAPWPVVAKKQDRLNTAQLNAANSGITSSLVAQIIANTAAIRALESAITGTGLRALVVSSLPAVGTLGILYIVPVTTYDPDTDADVVNYSNEYIWIVAPDAPVTEGYYEQVGQTGIVINNGQLTITVNGTSVGTFTANQSGDTTAAITVPTNADYVDKTTAQSIAGVKTFSDGIVSNVTGNVTGDLTGTASKAIADEDGTSIKTGYVNVAGNQTVTGQKTWSGNQFFTSNLYAENTSYTLGTTPSNNVVLGNYYLTAATHTYIGLLRTVVYSNGRTGTEIRARNKFKNGALDTTGTDVTANLNLEIQSDGAKTLYFDGSIRNDVLPYATNTYALGSSSYQWSSVYAQSYYYNGTAWGLDKENTWTQNQIISSSNDKCYLVKDTVYELGQTYSNGEHLGGMQIQDKNGSIVGMLDIVDRSYGNTEMRIRVQQRFDPDSNNRSTSGNILYNEFILGITSTKTNYIGFNADLWGGNTYSLGTSTNKWKTLNGVNPGALSLPDVNTSIAVDTTDWVYDGLTANLIKFNNAVQTFSGWLYITAQNTSASDRIVVRYIGSDASNLTFIGGKFDGATSIFVACPIVAGVSTYVWSTKALNTIKIYKALGNV